MPKANRANKATYEARVNKVFECLVNGLNRWQLWQFVTTNEKAKTLFAGVSRRQLDRYIQEASAMIATEAEYIRPKEIGKAKARLEAFIQASVKVQDIKTAIAAQRELNHLLSLYEPPAVQTIKLQGQDADLLSELLVRIAAQGMKPSDLFEAMLSTIAAEAKTNE